MATDVDTSRLRELAGLRPPGGAKVLTLYLDLDPQTFAAAPARETEVTSALDAAARMADECDLEHDALVALREDIERAREALSGDNLDAKGASGLALFACSAAGLFEIVKLNRPVATQVTIDDSPWIEPLVRSSGDPRLAVALIDRHQLRVFCGTPHELEEINVDSREFRRPADSGHPSEKRHKRASDDEAVVHYKRAAHVLLQLLKSRGYDVLVLDTREEGRTAVLDELHPYVRERVAGEIDLPDTEHATPDQVATAAAEVVAERRERQVAEALERLREGLGRGTRAAAGLEDVRAALEQARVEILLYERGRDIGDAVASAVLQDADVLEVDPDRHPELGPHNGVGAVLRY
jgi:Bacterial archaeo-eukaryotic release factor family 10